MIMILIYNYRDSEKGTKKHDKSTILMFKNLFSITK